MPRMPEMCENTQDPQKKEGKNCRIGKENVCQKIANYISLPIIISAQLQPAVTITSLETFENLLSFSCFK